MSQNTSTENLFNLFDLVQTGIMIIRPEDKKIIFINQAASELFGAPQEKIINHVCHKFVCPAEEGKCPVVDCGQKVHRAEKSLLTHNGDNIAILKTVSRANISGEDVLIESFADLSELNQIKSYMLQQDKLASVGQLAAGVAHEINNPIGFISSNINTLEKYLDKIEKFIKIQSKHLDDLGAEDKVEEDRKKLKLDFILEDIKELIDESSDGIGRISEIVQNLKTFSRVDEAKRKEADINECLEATIKVIWNELKYKADVKKDFGELPSLKCHPQELSQVFMNILVNASHAIEEHGEIIIKTRHEAENVLITISDTGRGIHPENINRLFEPFFTTKEVGKGTGLGLSISHEIIKNHDGEIKVESEVGKGTTFTIILPIN